MSMLHTSAFVNDVTLAFVSNIVAIQIHYKVLTEPHLLNRGDISGSGRIYGTTKIKGNPNYPVSKRVVLLLEPTLQPIAAMNSDAVTGEYSFNDINASRTYTSIAFDETGQFRPVAADRLVPEIMP